MSITHGRTFRIVINCPFCSSYSCFCRFLHSEWIITNSIRKYSFIFSAKKYLIFQYLFLLRQFFFLSNIFIIQVSASGLPSFFFVCLVFVLIYLSFSSFPCMPALKTPTQTKIFNHQQDEGEKTTVVEEIFFFFTFPNLLGITSCGLFKKNYDQISRIPTFISIIWQMVRIQWCFLKTNKPVSFFFSLQNKFDNRIYPIVLSGSHEFVSLIFSLVWMCVIFQQVFDANFRLNLAQLWKLIMRHRQFFVS